MKSCYLPVVVLALSLSACSDSADSGKRAGTASNPAITAVSATGQKTAPPESKLRKEAREWTQQTKELGEAAWESTKEATGAMVEKGKETTAPLVDKSKDYYQTAKEKSAEVYEQAKEKSADVYEQAKEKSAEYYEQAKEMGKDAHENPKQDTDVQQGLPRSL